MKINSESYLGVFAVLALFGLMFASPLCAQSVTYDFYVADENFGTGKFHSGTITRTGTSVVGSVYSWRHQRTVNLSGDLSTGVLTGTWQERVRRRWINKSATVDIRNANGGLPVVEENRRVLIGSWDDRGGSDSGVFGGYVP